MTAMEPETRGVEVDFDHRDEESAYNPWPRWARLRAEAPLAHSDKHGGFWVASRYEEVCAIARDPERFSSHLRQTTIPQLATPPFPPINYDPPENRIYRMIVNPFFSPAKVEDEYAPWIREMSARYVQDLLSRDGFDVPADLGIPLTREIILRIMGIVDAPSEVNQWSDDLVFQRPNAAESGQALMGFLAGELAARRQSPGPDFISEMVTAKYEDRPLDDSEILRISLLVLLAGLETTNSAISGSVWYLVRNRQACAELRAADDAKWRLAMDELVRWTSPVPAQARTARGDTEVAGCPIKANEMVHLLFGSANRDEAEFENPDDVVLDRHPNRHVGFGIGPHRCVGSHLAKLEMQVVLAGLLQGLGDFELREPDQVVWAGAEVRGIRSLPLVRK